MPRDPDGWGGSEGVAGSEGAGDGAKKQP